MIPRLAALAAIAFVLAACGVPDTADQSPSSPSVSSTATKLDALDISGLKVGDEPSIAWATGTLLNGDPARDVLPSGLDQFVQTKQLLVSRDVDGNVFAYGPDGPTSKTPIGTATGDLAINAERNLVAWIAADGSPTVLQEGEARPAVLEKPAGVSAGDAVAVLGHDCFNDPETVEGSGCSVYFRSTGSDTPRSYVASNHGFVTQLNESADLMSLQDADEDGDVGWTKLNDDQTTCSTYTGRETLDADTEKTWNTCDVMPLAFSPDGKHVLATGPHGYEGLGVSSLTILDRASGTTRLALSNNEESQAFIVDMQWEDASHVLAVVFQRGRWAMVRVGTDGSAELTTRPSRGEETDIEYRLSVQP